MDGTAADNGLDATFPKDGTIIDWCYYTAGEFDSIGFEVVSATVTWSVNNWATLYTTKSVTGNPSDHYPIYLKVSFR